MICAGGTFFRAAIPTTRFLIWTGRNLKIDLVSLQGVKSGDQSRRLYSGGTTNIQRRAHLQQLADPLAAQHDLATPLRAWKCCVIYGEPVPLEVWS